MKKYGTYFLVIGMLLFLTACGGNEQANGSKADGQKAETGTPASSNVKTADGNGDAEAGKVNWLKIDELEAAAANEKRKVMVDLYTDWCGWCKKMDKATFQHKAIADYLNEKFYAVKFNAENKMALSFKGKDYNFIAAGRRGYNELAHSFTKGRMSYPTIAFLDEDLNRIDSYPGFKQAHQFDPYLHFIAENHYQDKKFREFASTFETEIAAVPMPSKRRTPRTRVKGGQRVNAKKPIGKTTN